MLLKRINIILRYKNIEDKVPDIFNLGTVAAIKVRINKVKKITSITNLVTTASLNAKLNEVKNKTTSITNLATNIAFIAIENKINRKMMQKQKQTMMQKQKILKIISSHLIIINLQIIYLVQR